MDLHRLTSGNPITLVVGFSGSKAEVDWQLEEIPRLGISARPADGTEYWDTFWQGPAPVHRWSVLPSQTIDTLQKLGQFPFVAHAGNGIIYVRGGPAPPTSTRPQDLLRRLKETFDPQRVLPDF
jgi:hypothetical protein